MTRKRRDPNRTLMSTSRRSFMSAVAAASFAARYRQAYAGAPMGPSPGAPKEGTFKIPAGTMPRRKLGKTGFEVSLMGLGGFHIGIPKEDAEATRLVHTAFDHGVTFFDNCWDYNEGKSEVRLGAALAGGKREKVFVMTKLDGRTKESALGQLEQSLKRMRTDMIDLVQVHEVIRMTDPDRVFGPGGAMEALVQAKKAGKLRFIGFTGHKDPEIHLHMLAVARAHGFRFDTVQMPINAFDPHYQSFEKRVLPELVKNEIGALGMKPLGSGLLMKTNVATAPELLRYAMSRPVSVTITGCDTMGVLEQALATYIGGPPMKDDEAEKLVARTASIAKDGSHEKFKTSSMFDGTAAHPKWLEKAEL